LPDNLDDLPEMPDWLVALSVRPSVAEKPVRDFAEHDPINLAAHTYTSWRELLERHDWVPLNEDFIKWRHPSATSSLSATITNDCLFVYSSNTPFDMTGQGDPHGVTLFNAIKTFEFDGDQDAVIAEFRRRGLLPDLRLDDLMGRDSAGDSSACRQVSPVLPDEFWTARPVFEHVRSAARARMIAPDSVLVAVLMRVAALTDYRIVLPDIVGRYGSLNSAAVLVAPSGGGKGSTLDTAGELLPLAPLADVRFKDAPVGSGEGMVKVFFEQVEVPGENGKPQKQWEKRFDAVFFRIDEGEMLKSLGQRSGQTTMTVLRSAWSGERLGNSYSDRERRGLILPEHTYRVGLVMGVQPEHAKFLLDDAAGGTPQRFLWVALVDPTAPTLESLPGWPGPLAWQPPKWQDAQLINIGGYERSVLRVSETIVGEIKQRRYDINRGHLAIDPLDAHGDLVQLKTAALLAILDGRLDVNDDDWRLAKMICTTSRAVRGWVQRTLRDVAADEEARSLARATRRTVALEAAKASVPDKVTRVANNLVGHVARAGNDGITRGDLRAAITSNDRDVFDAALADAIGRQRIRHTESGRYVVSDDWALTPPNAGGPPT
jgi:hypothetical protein